MAAVYLWTLVYSISTAASIVLLGQRDLIGGNLFSLEKLFFLLLNWKFILSFVFALCARFSFVLTNNALLSIPSLADSSTTVTTFVTLICLIFVVIANIYFLNEKLVLSQVFGAALIMLGVFLMLGSPGKSQQNSVSPSRVESLGV